VLVASHGAVPVALTMMRWSRENATSPTLSTLDGCQWLSRMFLGIWPMARMASRPTGTATQMAANRRASRLSRGSRRTFIR
jgi:hypothetical protein